MPKGAIVSNRNQISCLFSFFENYKLKEGDVLVSFLPLAHGFGKTAYLHMFSFGGAVGNHCGDMKKLVEDINILKPTFFPCVPRLFNLIFDLLNGAI